MSKSSCAAGCCISIPTRKEEDSERDRATQGGESTSSFTPKSSVMMATTEVVILICNNSLPYRHLPVAESHIVTVLSSLPLTSR